MLIKKGGNGGGGGVLIMFSSKRVQFEDRKQGSLLLDLVSGCCCQWVCIEKKIDSRVYSKLWLGEVKVKVEMVLGSATYGLLGNPGRD